MTSLTCHFHRYTNVFFSHDPTFTGQRCSTDIGRHLRSATCCEPPFPPRSAHDLKDPKGDVLREGHTEEFQKISIYLSIHPSIYTYMYIYVDGYVSYVAISNYRYVPIYDPWSYLGTTIHPRSCMIG